MVSKKYAQLHILTRVNAKPILSLDLFFNELIKNKGLSFLKNVLRKVQKRFHSKKVPLPEKSHLSLKKSQANYAAALAFLLVKEEPSDHCIVDVSVNKAIIKQRCKAVLRRLGVPTTSQILTGDSQSLVFQL